MKNTIIRILESAAACLKSMQQEGLHRFDEVIVELDQTLQQLKGNNVEISTTGGSKHRFVAADRCNNVRYLTVQGSNIRLLNSHGQVEALSNIAHDSTQELVFALEDAASEEDMLDALNCHSYLTWKVYVPSH